MSEMSGHKWRGSGQFNGVKCIVSVVIFLGDDADHLVLRFIITIFHQDFADKIDLMLGANGR